MNYLILTPDGVGSTYLQTSLTVFLNDSGRSYTNTHEIAAGLELSKRNTIVKTKHTVPRGPDFRHIRYGQPLEEVIFMLNNNKVEPLVSRLAHYVMLWREENQKYNTKRWYNFLNFHYGKIFYCIRDPFEYAMSWGIRDTNKLRNVYSIDEHRKLVKGQKYTVDTEIIKGTGEFTKAGGITGGQASGVVQTGGVGAAKANVLNQQSYAHIQNAMANTQSLYSPDMQKYVNTLQNQYGVDAYTAHNHAMSHGGVEAMGGPGGQYGSIDLDFAKSSDFTQLKPNSAFEYTGGASEAAFKDKGLNYVGVKDGAFKVKGDTYHYGESGSGTSLLNKGKNAAGAYLSSLAGDDGGPGYVAYGSGADTSLNPFGTRYDGTNVAHAGGGQFLTEEQKRYFQGQDLNIQGA